MIDASILFKVITMRESKAVNVRTAGAQHPCYTRTH